MTRLWRAATLILTTTALVAGPAATGFATTGDDGARDGRPSDSAPDRRGDVVVDVAVDVVADQSTDAGVDRVTDRVRRPECDRGETTDRVDDCRETDDEIRPALKRCIHYIQTHTDLTIRRDRRWLWNACHRLVWGHTHPE